MEAVVTNTTSIYLVLNNIHDVIRPDSSADSSSDPEDEDAAPKRRLDLRPPMNLQRPACHVSLMVEIEGEVILGVEQASSILRIAKNLDPQKMYRIKITHMGRRISYGSYDEVFEFEGLWLDRPATSQDTLVSRNTTVKTMSGRTVALDETPSQVSHDKKATLLYHKPIIELVTSERPTTHSKMNYFYKDTEQMMEERVGAWYTRFGARLCADIALVPLENATVLPFQSGILEPPTAIKDLFFRSGPKDTRRMFDRPWNFASYQPAVLILQFGLADFVKFFEEEENANKRAMSKVTSAFVDAYVSLVHSIRSNAYNDHSNVMDQDGSYIYNSAPSAMPIFLLPPFSSRRRFVTKKLTLHKFISDALAQVASRLQAEGDKSTHWIDTAGWLDPREDFDSSNTRYSYKYSREPNPLTKVASVKVAALLADHICPYIKENSQASTYEYAFGDCAFDQYDSYLGNVYLPKDVELDRAVLERKVESIKKKFKLDRMGLDGRGDTFLHKVEK